MSSKYGLSLLLTLFFTCFQTGAYERYHMFKQNKEVKSCPEKAEPLASEFLLAEEKGARVYKGKAACINNTELKYVKAGRPMESLSESGLSASDFIKVKKGTMKIESVKELSAETLEYEVKFTAVDVKTGKTLKDSFKFMASSLAKGNKKPSFGCGHMSEYPLKKYISEDCL